MKDKLAKIIIITLVLIGCFAFVAKFGGPALLRGYLAMSLGDCRKIPIYCMSPGSNLAIFSVDNEYIRRHLVPFEFPKLNIAVPRGFMVILEDIKKISRVKKHKATANPVIYLSHKNPDFFMGLFPRLKKRGITNDYEFLRRAMNARLDGVNNLTDLFFMVMKGIFISDLGPQQNATMLTFNLGEKKGFINYNITGSGNYFDIKYIDGDKGFFSMYIKDIHAELNINQVCAILSTITDK